MTTPRVGASKQRPAKVAAPREIIARDPQRSFRSLVHDFPSEICGWAAHPEYEVHLIQKSTGSIIAGDYVGTFGPGHVSMMGPMLPHDWVSDLTPGEVIHDRDVVVQFTDEWVRECMGLMPELQRLDGLLIRARRGLEFTGQTAEKAAARLTTLVESTGPAQIAHMFDLLGVLADAPPHECAALASEWLGKSDHAYANVAVEAGLAYIFDHLTGDIRLSHAAALAHMSESTFSKYFKRAAGATFSSMVKRLRVAHARRLLDTTDWSTSKVAQASGYKNLSNFNRQFLAEMGMTPTSYRKLDLPERPTLAVHQLGTKATQPGR